MAPTHHLYGPTVWVQYRHQNYSWSLWHCMDGTGWAACGLLLGASDRYKVVVERMPRLRVHKTCRESVTLQP